MSSTKVGVWKEKSKDKEPTEAKEKTAKKMYLKDVKLEDYKTHLEAAQAMATCLSGYKSLSPSDIRETVVNYMHKELQAGLKIREELIAGTTPDIPLSILTQCTTKQELFEKQCDLTELDYCCYFTWNMLDALFQAKNNPLNRKG